MAHEPAAHHPPYMRVFVFLIILTVLEVAAAFVLEASPAKVPVLVALAIAKAVLVAMYYMHLRFEGRVLRAIAVFPLILSILLALPPAFDVLSQR